MLASEEYKRRLEARLERARHYERLHLRIGNLQVLLAVAVALMLWAVLSRHAFSGWWLLLPLVLFLVIAEVHTRILRARQFAETAAGFYRRGLARIEDRWAGTGQTGERFHDPHHVYAGDLDLFGRGSLFELLSAARTRMGEETLARWLLAPAPLEVIRERQTAVAELRDRLDFREDLAVIDENVTVGVHPDALLKWAAAPARLTNQWIRRLAFALAGLAVIAIVVWIVYGVIAPLLAIVLVEGTIAFRLRHQIEDANHQADNAFEQAGLLNEVLARIEREEFVSPRLSAMHQQLMSGERTASHAITHLETLVERIRQGHNFFLQLINIPLLYMLQLAFAVENWRRKHGGSVPQWLAAVGEIEALLSLATYSYEHPDDPFPEFLTGSALFDGVELGHPLIPGAKCVRNSVKLGGEAQVLLVSGSNMSGKSTLLRAVGINTVLAMAGAPVRAQRVALTPLQLGASIRVDDSLQEGSSRFYAEISRLRRLVDLAAGEIPLLFLIDEFLQGTNSRDRLIGADGLIRALISSGAIGLVTTHDLALTEIAGGAMCNVHFQDYLENGHMRFDYKLRDGVVARSNGVELMRSIGLIS